MRVRLIGVIYGGHERYPHPLLFGMGVTVQHLYLSIFWLVQQIFDPKQLNLTPFSGNHCSTEYRPSTIYLVVYSDSFLLASFV